MPRRQSRLRLSVMGLLVFALFAALFVRLWYLQVLDSPTFQQAATSNQVREVTVQAPRGLIVDRNGQPIVTNQTVVAITVARSVVPTASCGEKQPPSKYPAVIGRLADLLGQTTQQVLSTIADCRYSPYEPVPVATNVDMSKVVYLREHADQFPGVDVVELSQRAYPYSTVAAHILGYVGAITPAELSKNKSAGYQQGDQVGRAGVEAAYEQDLRGAPGVTDLEVNARGKVIGTIGEHPAKPGDDLQLTVDLGLQQEVDKDLAAEIDTLHHTYDPFQHEYYPAPAGSAIVLDPRNGAVLAMSSYPSYDPSVWVGGISSSAYQSLTGPQSNQPLLNRAIQGLYAPGSTFKLATATAALTDGLITPNTYIDDPGFFAFPNCRGTQCPVLHNAPGDEALGELTVTRAITASDDVFFYNLGYDFYENQSRFGPEPIQTTAHQYGLGAPTHFVLGDSNLARVDSPSVRKRLHAQAPRVYTDTWFAADNVEMAFGQGATVITPLELADAYAAFANGGTLYQPQVAARVVDHSGKVVSTIAPKVLDHVDLPPTVHDTLLTGFKGVVSDPKGTAYGTFLGFPLSQFPVAGKTGTATASAAANAEPTSLFVSFAPADNPQYVVAVVIEQAGYGASGSAPVARQILSYLMNHPAGDLQLPVQDRAQTGASGPAGAPQAGSTGGSAGASSGGSTTTSTSTSVAPGSSTTTSGAG
ncbi:MAG TPA: penicillin-binding protein 2 [Acidimicrobiales bacterium]|nr:penicillin-binding protein 2 [Acidimicrobiales bacterium]